MYCCLSRVVVFAGVALLLLVQGCGGPTEEASQEQADKLTQEFLQSILEPDKEKIALLASKYKISEDQAQTIIKQYMSAHDLSYNVLKSAFQEGKNLDTSVLDETSRTAIRETLRNLSEVHDIAEDVIASLIIDYRIWSAAEESANNL